MKAFNYRLLLGGITLFLLGSAVSCSNKEKENPGTDTPRTWQVVINAGPSQDTRALSVGGSDGKTLYTNWDPGDPVRVVKSDGTVLEQLLANVSSGNSAYAVLTGTLTGTFTEGEVMSLHYHEADLDYVGQVGTINSVSANYSFMDASSTVASVDSEGGFLKMSDAVFSHLQAYFQLRFVDKENNPLQLESLSIYTGGGKLVKTKPLGVDATFASEGSPLAITPASATDVLFLALRDEEGADNAYHFKAVVGTEEYSFDKTLNPVYGHYYVGTVKISGAGADGDSLNEVSFDIADYSSGGTLNW